MTPQRARFSLPMPFVDDQTARDGSLWRFFACLPGGAVAGIVAMILLLIVLAIAVMILLFGHAIDPRALQHLRELSTAKAIPPNDLAATLALLCVVGGFNMAMFGGFVAFAAFLYKRKLLSYWTAARAFRWRLLLLGLAAFLFVLGPPLYFTRDLGSTDPSSPMPLLTIAPDLAGRLTFAVITPLSLLIAAATEEVLFRGWLLRHLSALIHNSWVALVLGGFIFSAVHLDFNPDAFLERAVMGIGLGYSALRLGGVEFPLGIHAGNNILIVLLIEPLQLTPEPSHPWNWAVLPALLVILISYVAFTELVARWKPLARWAKVEIAPAKLLSFD